MRETDSLDGFGCDYENDEPPFADGPLRGRYCTMNDYPGMAAIVQADDDQGHLVVVWIGDDKRHHVAEDDVTLIERNAFCGECGQMGCTHDGRSFDDN